MVSNFLRVILFSTAILNSSLGAQTSAARDYASETYGASSGGLFRGIAAQFSGLLMELVRADRDNPALRLFGGTPQTGAVILIGNSRCSIPENGVIRLVDPSLRITGQFDPWGCFEIPLSSLPSSMRGRLYAQGVHTTLAGLECSNGIAFGDRASFQKARAKLDTAQRELIWTSLRCQELTEMLRLALASKGDSLGFQIDLSVSSNLLIPGLDLGLKRALATKVVRKGSGTYDVSVDVEVAASAGAKIPGTKVAVGGGRGINRCIVYRFYSPDGVAHGLIGIALMQMLGGVKLPSVDRTMLSNAEAHYEASRNRLLGAQSTVRTLRSQLSADWNRYARETRWWVRPALLLSYYAKLSLVNIADIALSVALQAQSTAKAVLDAARARFAKAFAALTQARNAIWKARQVLTFADGHMHSSELRFLSSVNVNLTLGALSLPNVGFGFSSGLDRSFAVRRTFASGSRPERITCSVRQDRKVSVHGSIAHHHLGRIGLEKLAEQFQNKQLVHEVLSSGGKAGIDRHMEFEAQFDVLHSPLPTLRQIGEPTVEFGVDVSATHLQGVGAATTKGVGARASITVKICDLLNALGGGQGSSLPDRVAALARIEGTVKAQSRFQSGGVAGISIPLEVIEVGAGVSARWTDLGEYCEQTFSLTGAVKTLVFGK